jgi:uncharacterized protein with NRDE domain
MCLILIAHRADPRYRLVVASNRDEFFARPTLPTAYWHDAAHVLGGRDVEKGGTWMGVTRDGRWAAVTNFRDGTKPAPGARSRGELVARYLIESVPPRAYVSSLRQIAGNYTGFNLLVGNQDELHHFSNKDDAPRRLDPGIYGLSNGLLDAPWQKVQRGKHALRNALAGAEGPDRLIDTLLAALANRDIAEDHALPSTGISRDWESRLSAVFIHAPGYGTRASTVLVAARDGEVLYHERSFDENGKQAEDRRYRFTAPVSFAAAD